MDMIKWGCWYTEGTHCRDSMHYKFTITHTRLKNKVMKKLWQCKHFSKDLLGQLYAQN